MLARRRIARSARTGNQTTHTPAFVAKHTLRVPRVCGECDGRSVKTKRGCVCRNAEKVGCEPLGLPDRRLEVRDDNIVSELMEDRLLDLKFLPEGEDGLDEAAENWQFN